MRRMQSKHILPLMLWLRCVSRSGQWCQRRTLQLTKLHLLSLPAHLFPLAPAYSAGSSRRSSTGSRSLTAPHLGDVTQVRGRVEVLDDQRVLEERTQDQLLKGGHTFALDQTELQIIKSAHCPALMEQRVEGQQGSASAARCAATAQWNLQVLSWTPGQ